MHLLSFLQLNSDQKSVLNNDKTLFFCASRGPAPRGLCSVVAIFLLLAACAGPGFSQQSALAPVPKSSLDQADALLKEGKPGEAISLLSAVVENDPRAPGLEAELGKAYFQSRQFSQAAEHLKVALQQNPDDLQSTQLLALAFYSVGNYAAALPVLEKLGPKLPKDAPDGPYLLSICYVMTQQWENARKSLAQMFSVPPESAMAYLSLGKLLVRQHLVDLAVPQVETALRSDPRIVMAHFLLGEIDLYQSNPQGAVSEFQKELAVNPTLWLVYWRLGDAYMRLEKYDEAEKILKEAIWLNEASPGAYVLLGEIAVKKNDPALASGFLARALALDPQNGDAHYALATAYKQLGRESDANQQFEISKKLRSGHKVQTDALELLP